MSDAGRVVAGSARGTRLIAPGEGTRPMGDRVKETLFAILEPKLPGAKFLDLFAGSGAGGIEALSRGSSRAFFVERDQTAVRAIGENLARARVAERGIVHKADAISYLRDRAAAEGPFDVVLLDPPYAEPALLEAALTSLGDRPAGSGLLAADSIVVAKHFWRTAPPESVGLLASFRSRRFGETALTFYRGSNKTGQADETGNDIDQNPPLGSREEATS